MKAIDKITPGPGQESVWDYPRPPKVEDVDNHIKIIHEGTEIVNTTRSKRVLETSHPPVYYVSPEDVKMEYFILTEEVSFCEFKGKAFYYDLKISEKIYKDVAWVYLNPSAKYPMLKDLIAFYPKRVDECYVNDERVIGQEGDFYGGWITSNIVGPFKGGPGTWGW